MSVNTMETGWGQCIDAPVGRTARTGSSLRTPAARDGALCVFRTDTNQLFVHGGRETVTRGQTFTHSTMLSTTVDPLCPELARSPVSAPNEGPARYGHAGTIFAPSGTVLIHGGKDSDGNVRPDVFLFKPFVRHDGDESDDDDRHGSPNSAQGSSVGRNGRRLSKSTGGGSRSQSRHSSTSAAASNLGTCRSVTGRTRSCLRPRRRRPRRASRRRRPAKIFKHLLTQGSSSVSSPSATVCIEAVKEHGGDGRGVDVSASWVVHNVTAAVPKDVVSFNSPPPPSVTLSLSFAVSVHSSYNGEPPVIVKGGTILDVARTLIPWARQATRPMVSLSPSQMLCNTTTTTGRWCTAFRASSGSADLRIVDTAGRVVCTKVGGHSAAGTNCTRSTRNVFGNAAAYAVATSTIQSAPLSFANRFETVTSGEIAALNSTTGFMHSVHMNGSSSPSSDSSGTVQALTVRGAAPRRLSVQPVEEKHYDKVLDLAEKAAEAAKKMDDAVAKEDKKKKKKK